jgi:hypothetical protein
MLATIKGLFFGAVCVFFPAMIPFVALLFLCEILKIFSQGMSEILKSIK